MRRSPRLLVQFMGILISLLALTACHSLTLKEQQKSQKKMGKNRIPLAAVIVDPDDASREELRHVVAAALNQADILLAPDALTQSHVLVVQRKHSLGRDLGRPEVFRLYRLGSECILEHGKTSTKTVLSKVHCTPIDSERVKMESI